MLTFVLTFIMKIIHRPYYVSCQWLIRSVSIHLTYLNVNVFFTVSRLIFDTFWTIVYILTEI